LKPDVARRLEKLRSSFAQVTGKPFNHFFCPILFRDEEVPLCQAHVINQAIPHVSRRWTVQREDVDNFFGAFVEPDFVDLQHRAEGIAIKALLDPVLNRRFRPRIVIGGRSVDYFVPTGPVPDGFSTVIFDIDR
jgi:hypothetical protein